MKEKSRLVTSLCGVIYGLSWGLIPLSAFAESPTNAELQAQVDALQQQVEALQQTVEALLQSSQAPERQIGASQGNVAQQSPAVSMRQRDVPQAQEDRPLSAGWDRGFMLQSSDGNHRLNIGGWIQPRYEFERPSGDEDTSSFAMRRVRLDVRGHVFLPELTFRVMSEHARTSTLRDAWIDYAFSPGLQVRAGQFTVPFQWHRFVSPRRQHFVERGVPSETFGFLQGRDIGVMAHGQLLDSRLAYGVGFFDGAGRNVATSNSDGNMASARLTWAAAGAIPREESDYAQSQTPQLSFGGGVQSAWRNELRDWDLGRSPVGNGRADWTTATADARFAWRGISIVGDAYLRHVDPQDASVGSYDGRAYMISAGAFLVPGMYELVGRWSRSQLDSDVNSTRTDQWGVGLSIYHRGHDWKTRINYLNDRDRGTGRSDTMIIEHHLQF